MGPRYGRRTVAAAAASAEKFSALCDPRTLRTPRLCDVQLKDAGDCALGVAKGRSASCTWSFCVVSVVIQRGGGTGDHAWSKLKVALWLWSTCRLTRSGHKVQRNGLVEREELLASHITVVCSDPPLSGTSLSNYVKTKTGADKTLRKPEIPKKTRSH